MLEAQGNSSGTGKQAVMPDEIKGWNWGAFFLNWIWGIGNSTWLALLMFVPFVNLIVIFVLGAKGSQWAWQNRYWRDVEHFKSTQRKWTIAGLIIWVMAFGLMISVLGLLKGKAYELSLEAVRSHPEVVAMIGEPIVPGYFVLGEVDILETGVSGYAELYYSITGSKGKAHVAMRAIIDGGDWVLRELIVENHETGERIVLLSPGVPAKKVRKINARFQVLPSLKKPA